jgi:Ca-activated chloride channel family protein
MELFSYSNGLIIRDEETGRILRRFNLSCRGEKGGDHMKKCFAMLLVLLLMIIWTFSGCSRKGMTTDSSTTSGETESTASNDQSDTTADYDTSQSAGTATTDTTAEEGAAETAATADSGEAGITESSQKDTGIQNRYNFYQPAGTGNTEEYTEITEANFKDTNYNPLSTFSIDVDTASYTNLRKNLNNGIIPEADAVRIEEMLNYFDYDYEEPTGDVPFTINTEIGKCPWNEEHYLLTVGIQGKNVDKESLPKSNLVFLIDVSGSMDEPDKLPLLKNAFSKLVETLGENDKVSIVVYAGTTGVVLDSVRGDKKNLILDAIEGLDAGGSTGGAAGIDLAYDLAEENFMKGGNNRVILATDGDFNVGPSSVEELEDIISEKKESGIFLSVMGFGSGNLKDNRMETLADKGNGNYSYIDSTKEARKVLVDEMAGTLLTIAKDVKIQIEFNPYSVESYRLIGYENRALADEDFRNDTVDGGELGAGHRVTAVYEIIPRPSSFDSDSNLKYQTQDTDINLEYRNEISEVRLRYKEPAGEDSKEIKQVVSFQNTPVDGRNLSEDFYFAAAVAEFGMILRDSQYKGDASADSVLELAEKGLGEDENGYRLEFMMLVDRYEELGGYQW